MSEQAFKLDKDMQDAIYLIACAVKEVTPDRERVQGMDLQKVFAIAEGHSLATAAAFAVEAAGFQSGQTTKILAEAVLRNTRFSLDREAVTAKLREAGIWHVLLKGAVLRDYYPKPEMREMSDHDILFDDARSADVKAIMEGLGYEVTRFGHGVHDVYQKPPVMNFEMHRELFSNSVEMEGARAYYKDVYDRLLGEGPEKHFSPEDFYIHMIAHEYKHYVYGGTGIRSVLDTYLYLSKVELNEAYVTEELEKLKIAGFEKANRALAFHLFDGEELTEDDLNLLEYILSSGTYGTVSNKVKNQVDQMGGGKLRYALSRFLVPVRKSHRDYEVFSEEYPLFYKHKILLPILPFYRVIRGIRRGKLQAEVKALRKVKKRS